MKSLSLVLFIAIATLIAYSMEFSFWVSPFLYNEDKSINKVVSVYPADYSYGLNQPISLGDIKMSENAYFRLKLRFRVDDTNGYPNVFQTASINNGLRMEIAGSMASLVVHDVNISNGLRGLTLTDTLEKNRWYVLEVEALNHAFVRASLDGVPVANNYGGGLSIDMSDIKIGAGFDDTRIFRGKIDNVSVSMGNLPSIDKQNLLYVYVLILTLIVIFIFVICKALSEYASLRFLLSKIILLSLPLILIIGYIEYQMSFSDTDYFARRINLEHQIDNIEVLVIGSSNTFYGIAPEAFSYHGFNLAFPGSSMYFDKQIVERYSTRMPKLKLVILTANFYTMGLNYSSFNQSWRQFALRQYFDVPIRQTAGLPIDGAFWTEPRNFSKIALYGKVAIGEDLLAPVDVVATESGWFDAGIVPVDSIKKFGVVGAKQHNSVSNVEDYDHNLSYWESLIPLMKSNNVAVLVTVLPTDKSYYENLDIQKVKLMNQKLTEFSMKYGVKFVNYTADPRFSKDDFSWEMPDHMNARGAIKLSRIIDKELIQPYFNEIQH